MKLKRGDIFSIEIDQERIGFGQILFKPKHTLFIIVFEEIYSVHDIPQLKSIVKPVPLLMGFTLDGMLYNNYWKVVGNFSENLDSYPFPFYKEGVESDETYVINHKSERIRLATPKEQSILNFKSNISPIYYEDALKAYHKVVPWEESFNEILYKDVLRRSFIAL